MMNIVQRSGLGVLLAFILVVPTFALAQTCGDHATSGGEECDDGNTVGGDGCAANCTLESELRCELAQGSGKTVQAAFFTIPSPLSGQLSLRVGGLRADRPADPVPFVIPKESVFFPLAVIPGIATSCTIAAEIPGWGEANAGGGLIDCGSSRLDGVDVQATLDSAAAQPALMVARSGTGAMGSVSFEIGLSSFSIFGNPPFCVASPGTGPPEYGPDKIPCTGDDPTALPAVTWYGTSGTAVGRTLNVNGSTNTIQAMVTGSPIACAQLDGTAPLSGAKLVAVLPAVDQPSLGDVVQSATLVCAPTGVLPTPTARIIPTCVPTPTPTQTSLSGSPLPTATSTPTRPPTQVATATGQAATPTTQAATPTSPQAATPTSTAPPTAVPSATNPGGAATPTQPVPPTATVTGVPPASPTMEAPTCAGDCNGDGFVTDGELELAVNIALLREPLSLCEAADPQNRDAVAIDDLVRAVINRIGACTS